MNNSIIKADNEHEQKLYRKTNANGKREKN